MKFIDWFAGVGGFRKGMELAGHECVGFCEFDKFATASYVSMHLLTDEQREYLDTLDFKKRQKEILKDEYRNGEWYADDIRRVYAEDIPESDCWCFGFPCQDISVAGKQLGFTGNRSSLFFRVMYLLGQLPEEKKPTYLFIENVRNLLSVNGGWDFARLLVEMDSGGYDAEWQILNSKEFGVPQNRERCFIIGHLRGRSTTEVFPVEGANGADRLYGIRQIGGVKTANRDNPQIYRVYEPDGVAPCLNQMAGGREPHTIKFIGNKCELVGNIHPSGHGMNGNCYFSDGISPALTTNKGEGNKIAIRVDDLDVAIDDLYANRELSEKGYERIGHIPYEKGTLTARTGVYDTGSGVPAMTATQAKDPYRVAIPVLTPDRANKRQNGRRFKEDGEEAFTLTGQDRHGVAIAVEDFYQSRNVRTYDQESPYAVWYPKKQCYIAIRKLTPKECFRLQGWTDDYFEKAQFVNSDSQLYKQAGNGVTVTVIEAIAKKMKIEDDGNGTVAKARREFIESLKGDADE